MKDFDLTAWVASRDARVTFACAANDVPEQCLRLVV